MRKFAIKTYDGAKKVNHSVMKHANLAASKYDTLKGNLSERLGEDSGINDLFSSLEESRLGATTQNLYGRVGEANTRVNTLFGRVDDTVAAVNDTFTNTNRDALSDFQRS